MKRQPTSPRGVLITFEGTEGAGKSTLIALLEDRLRAEGHPVTRTREPGGSPLAEKIRSLILAEGMDPWTELFLYEAARSEHMALTVLPALNRGEVVLCDRFTDSTLAYQGSARGLPWPEIRKLNRTATRGIAPKLTFWLDVDPAAGLARASVRTRFEDEGVAFQKKVRGGYAKLKREEPRRFRALRSDRMTPEELCEKAWAEIRKALPRPRGRR